MPAAAYELVHARRVVAFQPNKASFTAPDRRRAPSYLARDPRPGGVIARSYLGALVPGATGRHTLVGDCLWSEPDCTQRLVTVRDLFTGGLSAPAARRIVHASGARLLFADCRCNADLKRLLEPVVESLHTFGYARVYAVQ